MDKEKERSLLTAKRSGADVIPRSLLRGEFILVKQMTLPFRFGWIAIFFLDNLKNRYGPSRDILVYREAKKGGWFMAG